MKKVILLGTSNSIKAGSYYKELSAKSDISIIANVRVGDVPASYFLSAEKALVNACLLSEAQYIIIDSMINDVLMTESGVLDITYIEKTFENLGLLCKGLSTELPHLILFNICPKAVESAKVFKRVKNSRKSALLKAGLEVSEVDVLHSKTPLFFDDNDPLHHSAASSEAICRQLILAMDLASENPLFHRVSEKALPKLNYIDLGNAPTWKISGHAGFFKSSLVTQPVCKLNIGEELQLRFSAPVNPMGLTFIASDNAAAVIKATFDGHTFYIPASSAYPKPIIRFCPFPKIVYSKRVQQITLAVISASDITDSSALLTLPNAKLEEAEIRDAEFVSISGLVTDKRDSEIEISVDIKRTNRAIKVAFDCFWPGFKPESDPIFGTLLQRQFNVVYCDDVKDADIVFVSWCSPDKSRKAKYAELKESIRGKLVYYTAEHDGAGLEGEGQLDFDMFDHIFSHYIVTNEKHTWLPNYARRHGINVFSTVNRLYKQNLNKAKCANIQFCYSNDACEFRNKLFKSLNGRTTVDANGSLYNTTGYRLPREHDKYIEELSKYRFVIACENSSSPGYNTEKIVHALMAGAVPLYWGDPLIGSIWNEDCFINLHSVTMEQCVDSVAGYGEMVFSRFKAKGAIPFPKAEELEKELENSIFEAIKRLSAE